MVYVVASKGKACSFGFNPNRHRTNSTEIILNNKEIVCNQNLSGTFEERVAQLNGVTYSEKDLLHELNDWLNK